MRNDRVKDNLLIDYNKNAVLSSATESFCNFIVSNVASSIDRDSYKTYNKKHVIAVTCSLS